MKRFKFRLHWLERLRHMTRRAAEESFGRALAALAECRGRREAREQRLAAVETHWLDVVAEGGVDGAVIAQAACLLDAARDGLVAARGAEQAALVDVEAAEKALVEASRQHRVLEKLQARRKRHWLEEGEREEQRLLDEFHLLKRGSTRRVKEKGPCEDGSAGF